MARCYKRGEALSATLIRVRIRTLSPVIARHRRSEKLWKELPEVSESDSFPDFLSVSYNAASRQFTCMTVCCCAKDSPANARGDKSIKRSLLFDSFFFPFFDIPCSLTQAQTSSLYPSMETFKASNLLIISSFVPALSLPAGRLHSLFDSPSRLSIQ